MNRNILFAIFLIVYFSVISFAQSRSGEVVEVLDGKTLIIEDKDKTQYKVQLRQIEIPASEFPISSTIKDHLASFVNGKTTEFEVCGIDQDKNIARVHIGGTDLSKQMVRDGAAWYDSTAVYCRSSTEIMEFQNLQSLAKSEKRGLWAISGLKSTIELKAESEAKAREADRLKEEDRQLQAKIKWSEAERKARENVQMWPDVPELSSASKREFSTYNVLKILEVTSNLIKFYDRSLTIQGKIEISTSYWGEYDELKSEFYAFELSDGSDRLHIYMRRNAQAERLRALLLQGSGRVVGNGTFDIIIRRNMQTSDILVTGELIRIN